MASDELTCRLKGCDGPRSGVCINSLSFEDCPDVVPVEEASIAESETTPPFEDLDEVPTGGVSRFTEIEADAFLRRTDATLVAVIAPPEVGKTTLLATLYERLSRGELPALGFAGSETLRGYEERCHLSRMASNSVAPDTQRTRREVNFLHLRIAHADGVEDVLFSDRSGELFDEALDAVDQFPTFLELRRAGVLLFLLDFELLFRSPHEQRSKLQRTILALHQHGLLDQKSIALVGTKADRIDEKELEAGRLKLADLAANLATRAPNAAWMDTYITAARKRAGEVVAGEGVENLAGALLPSPTNNSFHLPGGSPAIVTPLDRLMRLVTGGAA